MHIIFSHGLYAPNSLGSGGRGERLAVPKDYSKSRVVIVRINKICTYINAITPSRRLKLSSFDSTY